MGRTPVIGYMANPATPHDCKWINRFAERYRCVVFSLPDYDGESRLNEGIEHYPILPSFPRRNFIRRVHYIKQIKGIIDREGVNIIHTLYAYPHGFWARLVGFDNHIITTRGSDVLIEYRNASKKKSRADCFFERQFRLSFAHARFITSTSYTQKKLISSFVNKHDKLSVIRSGIDVKTFTGYLDQCKKPPEGSFNIFSPRSMKALYNIDTIVHAVAELSKTEANLHLWLINDCPDRIYTQHVLGLIRTLSLDDKVTVLPQQDVAGMAKYYTMADVVISIPKSDGTPNTVLEAMLARKPVIMGACGYDDDLFGGMVRLSENTGAALANELEKIIRQRPPADVLDAYHDRVLKHAGLDSAIERIDALYHQCLETQPV